MSDILVKIINASIALLILSVIFKILKFVFGTSWKGMTVIYDFVSSIKETIDEFRGNLSSEDDYEESYKKPFKDTEKENDESTKSSSTLNTVFEKTVKSEKQFKSAKINKPYKINNKTIDFNKYKNNRMN